MIEKSKIANVLGRLREVEAAMGDPAVIADAKRYRAVVAEHAALRKLEAAAPAPEAAPAAETEEAAPAAEAAAAAGRTGAKSCRALAGP